jgi:hypothetical protein
MEAAVYDGAGRIAGSFIWFGGNPIDAIEVDRYGFRALPD